MSVGIIELGGDFIGMGQFHKNMTEALDSIGIDKKIYTSYRFERPKGYSRINLIKFWTSKNIILRYIFLIQAVFRLSLIIILRRHKYYVLHYFGESSYNIYFALLFKVLGYKYVVFVHDLDSLKNDKSDSKYILINAKILVGLNDVFVVDLKKLFPNTTIIKVQHPRYNEVSVEKNRTKEIRVLFWGHLKKSKGLDILLDAVSSMKIEERLKFRFSISGQNASYTEDELAKIVARCAELRISISTCFSSDIELSMMLNETDVVVLPYKRVYQSGAILHSIAHRACIVASDIPFFAEELSHGDTGILFESENHVHLKEALLSLNHHQIEKISKSAYENYVNRYSVENLAKDLKRMSYAL